MAPENMLVIIKLLHTLAWGVMAGSIMVLPWLIVRRSWRWVGALMGMVLVECVVLAVNGMRCPLTDIAARYTAERAANFDIYLPEWLAANNKTIFGTAFGVEMVWVIVSMARRWSSRDSSLRSE